MKTNFKVLIALMGLEIGGAETHVLELCKNLRKRGIEVYVVSNGGAYEGELIRSGIKHFHVPLHNKNPLNLIASYKALKKIIKQNNIKLVHAHARIPAFLCGLLQKQLKFRFITTCHGVYSTELPLKMLTNWGEKTLAVSEDIKTYLIDNYGLEEDNVIVTINGIDMKKFSPKVNYINITDEFVMNPSKKRLLYIGRLDKEVSSIVHKFLECIEYVYNANKNLEVFIVGDGTDFNEIKRKATEINKRLKKRLIILTGARTDVNKFLASADVFVGISRAALEAMSAEVPVILAGTPGYIGIFDDSKLDIAIETNFCCRGCPNVRVDILQNDILRLLNMSERDSEKLGKFARSVVQNYYSVDNMTNDALEVYESVLRQNKRIDAVVLGYYGSNNHGDDILLKAITDDLKSLKQDINIVVLSKRPKETEKEYNVTSIRRTNLIKVSKILNETNLLISGGGTLIQDLTSTHSLIYYLFIIYIAIKNGAKVMLYANGIGPVNRSERNRMLAAKVLNKVDLITLRDLESENVLKELKISVPEVVVTADPAFGINIVNDQRAYTKLRKLRLYNKKYFCVAIRSWKHLKDGFEKEISNFCEYIYIKHHMIPLFIPMQPENDEEISKRILSNVRTGALYLGNRFDVDEILGIIKNAEFVLAMRLHTIVYAAKVGTPIIGLVYDPKVKAMMKRLKQDYYCDVSNFSIDQLKTYADFVIVNKTFISSGLLEVSKEFEEKAFLNAKMAIELLEKECF